MKPGVKLQVQTVMTKNQYGVFRIEYVCLSWQALIQILRNLNDVVSVVQEIVMSVNHLLSHLIGILVEANAYIQ